jgi:hypothetical protein
LGGQVKPIRSALRWREDASLSKLPTGNRFNRRSEDKARPSLCRGHNPLNAAWLTHRINAGFAGEPAIVWTTQSREASD